MVGWMLNDMNEPTDRFLLRSLLWSVKGGEVILVFWEHRVVIVVDWGQSSLDDGLLRRPIVDPACARVTERNLRVRYPGRSAECRNTERLSYKLIG